VRRVGGQATIGQEVTSKNVTVWIGVGDFIVAMRKRKAYDGNMIYIFTDIRLACAYDALGRRAYLEVVRPAMEAYFKKFANHKGPFSQSEISEIENKHRELMKSAKHMELSAQYANEGTRKYFDGDNRFKRTFPNWFHKLKWIDVQHRLFPDGYGGLIEVTDVWKKVK